MKRIFLIVSCFTMLCTGCKKDWLDEKRDIKLVVPTTLTDLRLLLNNGIDMPFDYQGIGELVAGDFSMSTAFWKSQSQDVRSAYTWNGVFKGSTIVTEWNGGYKQIEICNVILDAIAKINPATVDQQEFNDIKGAALFFRAKAFYNLVMIFAAPYSPENLQTPGIHIRLGSDINIPVSRATIEESYLKIMSDLKEAVSLVKVVPLNKENPSKAAVYAQLARVCLIMGDYAQANINANSCLELYKTLLNFNNLKPTDSYPFKRYNDEVILQSNLSGNYGAFFAPNGMIDSDLYKSYVDNDLRKKLFFVTNPDKSNSFRGMYLGLRGIFSGIAVDEVYLIKAECSARLRNTDAAMKTLNELLITRFVSGTYSDFSASNPEEALTIILRERRKELILRGLRWSDLKRLNLNPATAITLKRNVDGIDYSLSPNDPRYAFPLPDYVAIPYSLEQNPGW